MTTVKRISILLILGFVCAQIFAQENEAIPRFGFGGGSFLSGGSMNSGGSADFSFLIVHKNVWDIRNHFETGGLFTVIDGKWSNGGIFTIGWKGWF